MFSKRDVESVVLYCKIYIDNKNADVVVKNGFGRLVNVAIHGNL